MKKTKKAKIVKQSKKEKTLKSITPLNTFHLIKEINSFMWSAYGVKGKVYSNLGSSTHPWSVAYQIKDYHFATLYPGIDSIDVILHILPEKWKQIQGNWSRLPKFTQKILGDSTPIPGGRWSIWKIHYRKDLDQFFEIIAMVKFIDFIPSDHKDTIKLADYNPIQILNEIYEIDSLDLSLYNRNS